MCHVLLQESRYTYTWYLLFLHHLIGYIQCMVQKRSNIVLHNKCIAPKYHWKHWTSLNIFYIFAHFCRPRHFWTPMIILNIIDLLNVFEHLWTPLNTLNFFDHLPDLIKNCRTLWNSPFIEEWLNPDHRDNLGHF